MSADVIALLEESIKLELNVSEVYSLYYAMFPDDAAFWWTLVVEEKNHAALLRSGKDHFVSRDKFPLELLHHSLRNLEGTNAKLLDLITVTRTAPPSRQEAFNAALGIENSAGELHFQKFLDEASDSPTARLFKKMNRDEKEHAKRIRAYMREHGIALNPDIG